MISRTGRTRERGGRAPRSQAPDPAPASGLRASGRGGQLLQLGTETPFGKVAAVGTILGERYYFFAQGKTGIAMMPAVVLE